MDVLGLVRGQELFEKIKRLYDLMQADLIPPNALTKKSFVWF